MTTAAARLSNEESERVCREGIAAVELYSEGMTPDELADDDYHKATELIDGLILYAHLLEATLCVTRGVDPREIRRKAKTSAGMWRKAATA